MGSSSLFDLLGTICVSPITSSSIQFRAFVGIICVVIFSMEIYVKNGFTWIREPRTNVVPRFIETKPKVAMLPIRIKFSKKRNMTRII